MNNRKTHVIEPRRRSGLGLGNFRELLEWVEADRPDTPVFSYMDYASGECTYVLPKEFRMQVEGLGTWLFESGKHKKIIGIFLILTKSKHASIMVSFFCHIFKILP